MTRILHTLSNMGVGGAEAFILNMYRNIDTSEVQFDFLLRGNNSTEENLREIEKYGGRVFITSEFPRHPLKNYREVKKILRENKFDAVHIHANSFIYTFPLSLAYKRGIPARILHSHNTKPLGNNFILKIIHKMNISRLSKKITDRIACSREAGEWMFGGRDFTVVKNGINIDKFRFNEEKRRAVRREFNLDGKLVVGHIGRFSYQKNHAFLLGIFAEILKKNENAALFLVGGGELKDDITEKAKALGIEKHIIFAGIRTDVYDLLQAFDVFVFPSHFEGMPITLVEAQASGLSCVISDIITAEADVGGNITRKPLTDSAQSWAEAALKAAENARTDNTDLIRKRGYDAKESARALTGIYKSRVG